VIEKSVLCGLRRSLREEGKLSGRVEAIYKLDPGKGRIIWLRDQARVEIFGSDSVCLSPGLLFDVSKEMEAEDELKRTEAALRASEEKYRNLSIRDNLTGLFNTRHLYQDLSRRIAGGDRFAVIFMDIDDFKRVVDRHGHLSASRALQEVAATIRGVLDAPAYGVAYGGDELVAVLPGFAKKAGMAKAEEIRNRIRETAYLSEGGKNVRLSISCGVSAFPEEASDLNSLLGWADRAMFEVKEKGKDAVSGGA
jgi:diguanylate cyclase (GGDEF)-like protein